MSDPPDMATSGTLLTDRIELENQNTWDTQEEWGAYQSRSGIDIINGILRLGEQWVSQHIENWLITPPEYIIRAIEFWELDPPSFNTEHTEIWPENTLS